MPEAAPTQEMLEPFLAMIVHTEVSEKLHVPKSSQVTSSSLLLLKLNERIEYKFSQLTHDKITCSNRSSSVVTSPAEGCKILQLACLSVRAHDSKTTCLNFTKFSVHVAWP